MEKGWSIDKLIEEETKLAFSSAEILGCLPGPSGTKMTANAYALGLQDVVDTAPALAEKDERALGSLLQIGYAQSQPQQFVEAYANAKAHCKIADEEYDNCVQVDENTEDDSGLEDDEEEEEEEEEEKEIDDLTSEDGKTKDHTTHWRGAEIVHAI